MTDSAKGFFAGELKKYTGEGKAVFQGAKNYLQGFIKSSQSDEDNDAAENQDLVQLRLKSLCANWLKMQNVVCLIGSGASYGIGCLLKDMKQIVKQYLNHKKKNLVSLFNQFFPDSESNFEKSLSKLVSVSMVLEDENLVIQGISKNDLDELIKIIQGVVFYCCNLKLPELETNDLKYDTHRHFVRKLIGRADPKLNRVKLVTTNYDTLLEQAMDSLGVLYMDSFIGTVNRKFDTSCFGLDYYYPGEQSAGAVARYDKFLHLYKIHGSINWWSTHDKTTNTNSEILTWRNVTESAVGFFQPLSESSPLSTHQIGSIDAAIKLMENQWMGIQPTSVKYSETMNMPYSHLFRYFANALKEPQTVCFVIGYSFGDTHINKLIYDALANPSFNLVIVAPSLSEGIQKILETEQLERVYWFAGNYGKFENFVKDIMPDLAEVEMELKIRKMLNEFNKLPNLKSIPKEGKDIK